MNTTFGRLLVSIVAMLAIVAITPAVADQVPSSFGVQAEGGHGHGDADEPQHDHATDHGVSVLDFIGRFHVIVTHFPIAFLFLAGVLEFAGLMRKDWQVPSTVRLLAGFGAVSAIVAMTLGLLHGSAENYSGTLSWVFWWMLSEKSITTIITLF